MRTTHLSRITEQFGLGECSNFEILKGGKVHSTFRIRTTRGNYILQILKPPFNENTVHDGLKLTRAPVSKKFSAPQFLVTNDGKPYIKEGEKIYRIMTMLPGHTRMSPANPETAYSAGKLVGAFHTAIQDFSYVPVFTLEGFHDLHYAHNRLKKVSANQSEYSGNVDAVIERLNAEILKIQQDNNLPRRCLHGDLKHTNILFGDTGEACAIIDFDAMMITTLPIELGDAFRSWCTRLTPAGKVFFDETILQASWNGYRSSCPPITVDEEKGIVTGVKYIILELSCRYVIDFFEDYYFAWDPGRFPDRRSHNIYRAIKQLTVFDDVLAKEDSLEEIINRPR